jgi:hypothetical protein
MVLCMVIRVFDVVLCMVLCMVMCVFGVVL